MENILAAERSRVYVHEERNLTQSSITSVGVIEKLTATVNSFMTEGPII